MPSGHSGDFSRLQIVNIGHKFIDLPVDLIPVEPHPIAKDAIQGDARDAVMLVCAHDPDPGLGKSLGVGEDVYTTEGNVMDTAVQAVLGEQTGRDNGSRQQEGMAGR